MEEEYSSEMPVPPTRLYSAHVQKTTIRINGNFVNYRG
jgi:hypothetical protein